MKSMMIVVGTRLEAVETGFTEIVGTDKQSILKTMEKTLTQQKELPLNSPYGEGNAANKIADIIGEELRL